MSGSLFFKKALASLFAFSTMLGVMVLHSHNLGVAGNAAEQQSILDIIINLYNTSPLLVILVAVVGFPEVELVAILALIVAALLP